MNYPHQVLLPLYRFTLGITKRRGLGTLSRLDSRLFRNTRRIPVFPESEVLLELPAHPHFFGYLLQQHEKHIFEAIKRQLKPGGTYVDIGANLGYFCAIAAHYLGKEGQIYAFEPNRENYDLLKRNRRQIRSHCAMSAFKAGVSDHVGTAELGLGPYCTYHSFERAKVQGTETETVDITTLDQFVKNKSITEIDLLKIDVEGHEPAVIRGAENTLESGIIRSIVLECREQGVREMIPDMARKFGYETHLWFEGNWRSTPRAVVAEHDLDVLLTKI